MEYSVGTYPPVGNLHLRLVTIVMFVETRIKNTLRISHDIFK